VSIAAVAITALVVIAGLTLALVWAVRKAMAKTEGWAGATVAAGASVAEFERATFERDTWKRAAEESDRLADHLAEELRHALSQSVVGAGLDDDDVDSRVLRFWEAAVAARAARGLPAGPDEDVHPVSEPSVADGTAPARGSDARPSGPG
jgi:hypothetical protein